MGAVTRRAVPGTAGALLLGVLAIACADLGPERGPVAVVFQPRFAIGALDGHENPALRVDNIRVLLFGASGDTLVDQVVDWPLDQDTLRAEVVVEVSGTETFDYVLQGREGTTVLFSAGPFRIELTGGSSTPVLVQPTLEYSGPEAGIATLAITGAPVALAAGGTVDLGAVGEDDEGAEVADPLVAWVSLDTLTAVVDAAGVVSARDVPSGTARIVARVAFRAVADTVEIPVEPATVAVLPGRDTVNALGFSIERVARPASLGGDALAGAPLVWTSSDPSVVRVLYTRGDTATLGSVGAGTAIVTVRSGSAADSAEIHVRQLTSAVAVLPTHVFFGAGDAIPLTPVAVDSGGSVITGASFTWSSSAGAVTVDEAGVATGQSAGVAEVTASFEGASGSARFEVGLASTAQVTTGDFHVCRLDTAGAAWCWGGNASGQLGDGTTFDRAAPVAVAQGALVFTALAAGGNHTCALATDGGTYCWGGNDDGQLGDGTGLQRLSPTSVAGGVPFTEIDAGGRHTCALTATGAAYCWGLDDSGQLGDGAAGSSVTSPQLVSGGLAFDALALGWLHTCGLTAAGQAYCWGRGQEGQLGHGLATDTVLPAAVAGGLVFASLSAGPAHSCGVTTGAAAFCWGYNSSGQLGNGAIGGSLAPAAVAGSSTAGTTAAGWVHTCSLDAAGAASCWGSNAALELGAGDPRAARSPLSYPIGLAFDALEAGGRRTCGTASGILVCWGGISPEALSRGTLISLAPGLPAGTSAIR